MAHPYDWPSEQEDRRRQDALRGQHARRAEDPGNYDRYDQPAYGRGRGRAGTEAEARRLERGLERGWRRLSEAVRRPFEEDRPNPYDRDPRRAGGMFGGHDRRDSLFSHGQGPGEGPSARPPGPYRGRGPRGYVRPDARILEDVSDRLADDGRLDASEIEVIVAAGEVMLHGRVARLQDKQRAEDLAKQASGVKQVQNHLRVGPAEPAAGGSGEAASMAGAAIGSEWPAPRPPTH